MVNSASPSESGLLLAGLRVIELGVDIAAPMVGMLLAEQGAEVVRVVQKARLISDPVLDAILARGKSEITLDLAQPEDGKLLRSLLAHADVVIENLGCTMLSCLGLNFEIIRQQVNSGLISCSITGFPRNDYRSELPDYEAVVGTAGFLYNKPLGKPWYHELPIGSITSALYAVNGIMAALIARWQGRQGQHVEIARYHADLFSQVIQILVRAGVPRGFLPMKMIGSPAMRVWLCQDQRYVYLHITIPAHNVRILELLEQAGYHQDVAELRKVMSPETMKDPSQVKSIKEAKQIRTIYERIFLTKTADDWEELLGKELCCIKVRTTEEWLRDSIGAGMSDACVIEDPDFGELMAPGPSIIAPDHPPTIRPRTRITDGGVDLLTRWESQPDTVQALQATQNAPGVDLSHPLQGVRVMDLSRVIAGPCATRVLAELGAEVLSVQSTANLDWTLSFHLVFNAGKKSVTLDFTNAEGKATLWALMKAFQPTAFVQNYRNLDLAQAIGVEPETVRTAFPGIAYTHLNAYGNEGIWKLRPGFEQVVQAVSGIQTAYARGGKPKLLPTPIIDIGCGLLGAFGTQLGIYHQLRTGHGVFVNAHLTSMSVLLQLKSIAAFQRDKCVRQAHKNNVQIHCDPNRDIIADIMRTLSGYVCVVGPRENLQQWLVSLGLAQDRHSIRNKEFDILRRNFRKRTTAAWHWSLLEAGVSRSVVIMPHPVMRRIVKDIKRYDLNSEPFIRMRTYPGCSQQLIFIGNPVKLSTTPVVELSPPPVRGADTQEALAAVGVRVPEGTGIYPYPSNKPFLVWLANFLRWGYFAWKSGSI